MFSSTRGCKLLVTGLLGLVVFVCWTYTAHAATTKRCQLGQVCLNQTASRKSAAVDEVIFFTIVVKNLTNNELKGMTVRYTIPRQTMFQDIENIAVLNNRIQRPIKLLHPGQSWRMTVSVAVLLYAPKRVANTAILLYHGQPWLKSKIGYRIQDSTR